ncbi:hypothetical protein FAM09_01910 [Niastella caeni]|uniref:Uncharacterized protein n=1 Tax=Niastella caeni TaxID=2569763 RepID=A0A4S8I2J3_9BACT|nr:hypothetical protein [Niastella caeni]THU40894.1 hypothetical protein FAM09_01910 [Niastella caeni]
MKTSNKVLLGIFLSILILTTAIQLMVYARYKNGEYVKFNREEYFPSDKHTLPPLRLVSLNGLGNCKIITSDTARLELQNFKGAQVTYRIVNDMLIIHGDTTLNSDQLDHGVRNFQLVSLYLPATMQINANYSSFKLTGARDSVHAPSYKIKLERYSDFKMDDRNQDAVYYKELNIFSDVSKVELSNGAIVNDLIVHLSNSSIDYKKATIRKMAMDLDSNSTITLSSNNLKALK